MARDHFYLNKTDGKLFGVCAGLADYLGVETIWIRVAVVVLTLWGFGSTIPLYLLVAFFASRRPRLEDRYDGTRDMEQRLQRTGQRRVRDTRLRSDLSDMDRRLAEMERHFQARD